MSKKTKTKSQETVQQDPWAPAIPFLTQMLGNANGIFDRYRQLSPDQQKALNLGTQTANDRLGSGVFGRIQDAGMNLVNGGMNPDVNAVSQVSRPSAVTAPRVSAQTVGDIPQLSGRTPQFQAAQVDPAAAYGASGVNPTGALARLMSGQVDNPQLQRMAEAATRTGQRTYRDAVEDSTTALTEEIIPSIGRSAQLSGQYGSNRHGIAEGKALAERERTLGRSARELGIASEDAASGLFGRAYESAQDRMAGTANAEAARALQVAEGNAGRLQQGGMFNVGNAIDASRFDIGNALDSRRFDIANDFQAQGMNADNFLRTAGMNLDSGLAYDRLNTDIGFGNNDQAMREAGVNSALMQSGLGMFSQGMGLEDDQIQSLLDFGGFPAMWELGLLGPTAGVIGNIGGMGGTRNSQGTSTTKSSDPMGFISNMAMAAAMAYSDERLKTDVETVGHDAQGRRWVNFSYIWEPGVTRTGVIAQEVQKTDPDAVAADARGFLMVDYSKLEAA